MARHPMRQLPAPISPKQLLALFAARDCEGFIDAVVELGCEYAMTGPQRMKLIMQEGVEVSDIYRIAAAEQVQIRRLNYKRDSLEDIFLKAME